MCQSRSERIWKVRKGNNDKLGHRSILLLGCNRKGVGGSQLMGWGGRLGGKARVLVHSQGCGL